MNNIEINSQNKYLKTPLHEAAHNGCLDSVKILSLLKETDVNLKDIKIIHFFI